MGDITITATTETTPSRDQANSENDTTSASSITLTQRENDPVGTQSHTAKSSIEILKEAKPSENLSIDDRLKQQQKTAPESDSSNTIVSSVDTMIKTTTSLNNDTPSSETTERLEIEELAEKVAETKIQPVSPSVDHALTQKERNYLKNKSDIFSLKESKDDGSTMIFSVGGIPSKSIQNQSKDTIDGASTTSNQFRNPVTGFGVSSNDEFKNKPPKRKDGNPVLGVGYKEKEASTGQRIPPGGYSKGIW